MNIKGCPRVRPGFPNQAGSRLFRLLLAVMLVSLSVWPVYAREVARISESQELRVHLNLQTGELQGHSLIRLNADEGTKLDIFLHPRMTVESVLVNGQSADYRFDNGRLRVELDLAIIGSEMLLALHYIGRFQDPVPMSLFSTDNTGSGVSATITEQGVFFQGQSGWFPRLAEDNPPINLEVDAPRGVLAITSGRLLGHEHREDRTISRWRVERLDRGMPLSAGEYIQHRLDTDTVPIYTYFFADSDHLAPIYLQASARHLATYEDLHGPYPFDHFAVVENFFPSGFGMPSYTLLGSTILRLPFIPETSLRHEIAHCWWGNGVFVDYGQGNWSEGLTTYVADYLAQEEQSFAAAREYRVRILRDYAQLAAGPEDFPVARFLSRSSPASQVVGYGKSMYMLHMIRQRLGDQIFWDALRSFYGQWLFKSATWQDLFRVFEQFGWPSRESETFSRQWLLAPGASALSLADVQVTQTARGWQTSGTVAQTRPYFHLFVPIRLETENSIQSLEIFLRKSTGTFTFHSMGRPQRLLVDPDHHLFRLLAAEEIPPTVNSIKGADDLLVVVSEHLSDVPDDLLRGFLSSLNQPEASVVQEHEADIAANQAQNLLFFGYPQSIELQDLLMAPEGYGLAWRETNYVFAMHPEVRELDAVFLTMPRNSQSKGVVAVFTPNRELSAADIADTARRITHYGKDSYLGFLHGKNRLRGTWPPLASPLTKELNE